MKLSIIICTKNRLGDLIMCINSLRQQTIVPYEIIIVDVSTDNLIEKFISESLFFNFVYLRQKYGYLTHARNIGIRKATGDIILFLDDDVILHQDYLENIIETFKNDKKKRIGGVQGVITNRKELPLFFRLIDYLFLLDSPIKGVILVSGYHAFPNTNIDKIFPTSWLSGTNMAFRKEIFNNFCFNESLSCSYDSTGYRFVGEDKEFSYRVGQKYLLVINPYAKIMHINRLKTTKKPILLYNYGAFLYSRKFWFDNYSKPTFINKFLFWWSQLGQAISSILKYFARFE